MTNDQMSPFAQTILQDKYLKPGEETWRDVATRVVRSTMEPYLPHLVDEVIEAVANREFMPAGRYLANAGGSNMLNNCLAAETRIITRQGVREIGTLAGTTQTILSRGEWVEAPINAFGTQSLRALTIRRAKVEKTIYATGNHGWFVGGERVDTDALRPGMKLDREKARRTHATPSVVGIQHGIVFGDGTRTQFGATVRLCGDKDAQLLKWFGEHPTRQVESDIMVTGLPRHFKDMPSIDYDHGYLYGWLAGYVAADGNVSGEGRLTLASTTRENLEFVRDVCNVLGIDTYGIRHQDRISNLTGADSRLYSLTFDSIDVRPEMLLIERHRNNFQSRTSQRNRNQWTVVGVSETDRVETVYCATVPETHEFALEDGVASSNCYLYRVEDTKEGIADFFRKGAITGMTGGGVGAVWSDLRPRGAKVHSNGGTSTGPCAFMYSFNEIGRGVVNGGARRMAIWAGLHWWHPDVFEFMALKDWDEHTVERKSQDFSAYAPMDMTNVSVILDDDFFGLIDGTWDELTIETGWGTVTVDRDWAERVYWTAVEKMLTTGEPGFSVDLGDNQYENLRNPCCEITSEDDSDVCCLGTINMAQVDTISRFGRLVELGTAFLLCGTLASEVPHEEVLQTRTKNRRLGLGLMGMYEWLVKRGLPYAPSTELEEWLKVYAQSTQWANIYADMLGISRPVKTRAIAPTGTIGILAETTTGIEPLFAVAYKRRYLKAGKWVHQYVIDATAQRLIDQGADPANLETAYDLARDPERRIAFQSFVQRYVDHGISSTLNLPAVAEQPFTTEEFGAMLLKHLPDLRGVTSYPDGSRGGQPLTVASYEEAIAAGEGVEYEELGSEQACVSGVCGV